MKIEVKRIFKGAYYTIGKMYLDGIYFCDTLEDTVRDFGKNGKGKVYGETAIPAGTYDVILSHSPKFKRTLPELLNVPYFEYIRIHAGNTAEDSHGCILVGENKVKGKVLNSRIWEKRLVDRLWNTDEIIIKIQ